MSADPSDFIGPIDVSDWGRNDDYPVFPTGSKPKRLLDCPASPPHAELNPARPYLFKTALFWRAPQIWSEVIASHLGRIIGFDVPPCYIAEDRHIGETGALVEFIYDFPAQGAAVRLLHGADLLNIFRKSEGDRPHELQTNIRLMRLLMKLPNVHEWWARLIAFDALIGNGDRHSENWGVLATLVEADVIFRYCPSYDHGSSLGYEQPEAKLQSFIPPGALGAYLDRGKHHCGIDADHDGPTPHFSLCAQFLEKYPATSGAMRSVIRFDENKVADVLKRCTELDVKVPFTPARAEFVMALIRSRRQRLEDVLGGR